MVRLRRAIQLYPITLGAVIATVIAAIALTLVLEEQDKGRERDAKLKQTDVEIGAALKQIRSSRVASVKISCRLNQGQNDVLLALIAFSIQRSKERGVPQDPKALAKLNDLLAPITKEQTKKLCAALLNKANDLPPPPPLPPL